MIRGQEPGETMHSMTLQTAKFGLGIETRESYHTLPLGPHRSSYTIDFSENPSLVLEVDMPSDVVYLHTPLKIGLLVNQDHSCWLTNMGNPDSVEVYRPSKEKYKSLDHQKVAYIRDGDWVGFDGYYFQLCFENCQLTLEPLSAQDVQHFRSRQ